MWSCIGPSISNSKAKTGQTNEACSPRATSLTCLYGSNYILCHSNMCVFLLLFSATTLTSIRQFLNMRTIHKPLVTPQVLTEILEMEQTLGHICILKAILKLWKAYFSDLAIKRMNVCYHFYSFHLMKGNSNKPLVAGGEMRANQHFLS